MKTTYSSFGQKTQILASSVLAIILMFTWLDISGNIATAQDAPSAETKREAAPVISEEEAMEIALEAVPGEVTDVEIKEKQGANRYIIEIIAKEDSEETDVIIDSETGKVLDTEK